MGCCCAPMKGSNNKTNLEGKVVVITGKLFLLKSLHGFSLIDINPALFPRSLFTYSALLLLGFLFTTVELWSLACCLEEFPSYAIVYFKANYFEIG